MAKRVILAVAGAGKTYHICHALQSEKKNLILAYTHENIHNIKRELISAYGKVPELTNVMTFDAFIYRYLVCPYEPTILQYFGREGFKRKGITTQNPPLKQTIVRARDGSKRAIANPRYSSKDKLEHYISPSGYYYCATLSELILQVKKGKFSLIKEVAAILNMFYDQIMIDEFQDFREHDFDLITGLAKHLDNILLVGDYFQHSVSAINNSGKPFKNKGKDVGYSDFISMLKKLHFEVDETTLQTSRRCSQKVCNYIQNKLAINIVSGTDHNGEVIWVKENIQEILENDAITKLVYNNAVKYAFAAVNWSYSKGATMDNVCVILTEDFDSMDNSGFSCVSLSSSTVNKLYVAMTRTRGNLYLLKGTDFKKIRTSYLK